MWSWAHVSPLIYPVTEKIFLVCVDHRQLKMVSNLSHIYFCGMTRVKASNNLLLI